MRSGARGELMCGVSGTTVGFSERQPDGSYAGFDVDYCRTVAAAVLGDADAVMFVPLASSERFGAVRSGQVDVLFRNTTVTQSRDTAEGVDFGPVVFYDGQQFMARAADGYTESSTVADLAGAVVCVNAGSTTELNLADRRRPPVTPGCRSPSGDFSEGRSTTWWWRTSSPVPVTR